MYKFVFLDKTPSAKMPTDLQRQWESFLVFFNMSWRSFAVYVGCRSRTTVVRIYMRTHTLSSVNVL